MVVRKKIQLLNQFPALLQFVTNSCYHFSLYSGPFQGAGDVWIEDEMGVTKFYTDISDLFCQNATESILSKCLQSFNPKKIPKKGIQDKGLKF